MFRSIKPLPPEPTPDPGAAPPVPPASAPEPAPPAAVVYSPGQAPPQVPLPQVPTASRAPPPPPVSGPQESFEPVVDANSGQLPPDHPYAFITNPTPPPKEPLFDRLPGGGSPAIRVGIILGVLLVLFIIFSVIKGILLPGPNLTPLVSVLQDQHELIHLVTGATKQSGLSSNDLNFIATLQSSLGTSQSQTISYLVDNHQKVSPKQLGLKVSASTDAQLAAAAAATTYPQTFHEVMQTKLNNYGNDLVQASKVDKGKKGRALISEDLRQLQLFQIQLTAATTN